MSTVDKSDQRFTEKVVLMLTYFDVSNCFILVLCDIKYKHSCIILQSRNQEEKGNDGQTAELPCYLDGLPPHAEYSCMEKDWIMDNVNLSDYLKSTRLP